MNSVAGDYKQLSRNSKCPMHTRAGCVAEEGGCRDIEKKNDEGKSKVPSVASCDLGWMHSDQSIQLNRLSASEGNHAMIFPAASIVANPILVKCLLAQQALRWRALNISLSIYGCATS